MNQNLSSSAAPLRISLIIPVHKMSAEFKNCLDAVSRLNPKPFELIVVADGNDEAAAAAARKSGAIVFATEARRGPAAARNLGGFNAQGEILFFVDADVSVRPDAIARLLSIFGAPRSPDAVIGSYDDDPSKKNFLSQYKNLLQHFVHQQAGDDIFTFWGACGAIRKNIFAGLGGFDERYTRPSIEDIELGYRLQDNGCSILLSKKLQVTHLKKWSVKSLFISDVFCRALPWSQLILSSRRINNDLNIKLAERIKIVLVYLILLQFFLCIAIPKAMIVVPALILILGIADWKLLRFFYHQRGIWFAVRVPAWHWFYYMYSGFAFGISAIKCLFEKLPERTKSSPPQDWICPP